MRNLFNAGLNNFISFERFSFHAFCSLCVCDSAFPLSVKSLKKFKLFHTFLRDKFNNNALFCSEKSKSKCDFASCHGLLWQPNTVPIVSEYLHFTNNRLGHIKQHCKCKTSKESKGCIIVRVICLQPLSTEAPRFSSASIILLALCTHISFTCHWQYIFLAINSITKQKTSQFVFSGYNKMRVHSFIPLVCAECNNSLPFSEASSIPLSLQLAIYF